MLRLLCGQGDRTFLPKPHGVVQEPAVALNVRWLFRRTVRSQGTYLPSVAGVPLVPIDALDCPWADSDVLKEVLC